MLTLVFLKLLSDLGLYYSFAGFFAVFAGADASHLIAGFLLQAAAGFLTYPLRERRLLRFLPLALLAVSFALPGAGYAEWITAAPPVVYVIYLVVKKIYLPDWSAQAEIFQIFWKILLGFCIVMLLLGCGEQLAKVTAPVGVISLTCCVVLTRSLRHDASVFCAPRFQLMNLLTVAVVMLSAAVLSSDAFLGAALAVISWIYQTVCCPILLALIWLLTSIIRVVIWMFSWIKFREVEQEETEIEEDALPGLQGMLAGTQSTGEGSDQFMQVLLALALVLAAVLVFFVFRWLSKRARQNAGRSFQGERTAVEEKSAGRRFSFTLSPVEQVRLQYRRYLRLCRANGFILKKSETSQEIEEKTEASMEPESLQSMRRIYIAARYHGEASKEDAAEAKRLYQSLAASAQKSTE